MAPVLEAEGRELVLCCAREVEDKGIEATVRTVGCSLTSLCDLEQVVSLPWSLLSRSASQKLTEVL